MIDLEKLEELAKAAPSGQWEVWTSNSWRRVMASGAGVTENVITPTVQRYDNHPDLTFGFGVKEWLEGFTPEVALALIAEVRSLRTELHDWTTCAGDLNAEVVALAPDAERYRRLKSFAHPSYNIETISNAGITSLAKKEFITVHAGTWEAMDYVLDGAVTVNTVNIKEQS